MAARIPMPLINADGGDDDDDDVNHLIATEQRRELMAFRTIESDLDLAFHLQLEEAVKASLSQQPAPLSSTSSSSVPLPQPLLPSKDDALELQEFELKKFDQEHTDHKISEDEARRMRENLYIQLHDRKVAFEIHRMSDDDWDEYGDNFELPYTCEGSSSGSTSEVFRLYFKGLVDEVYAPDSSGNRVSLAGIGVAICDSRDEMIFQLKKPLSADGMTTKLAVAKALIEGLNAAIALGLERIVFYCDYHPIYHFVTGRWPPKPQRITALINQIALLRRKFTYSNPVLVSRRDVRFAFKFAREAILSQASTPAEHETKNIYVNCVICLEDTEVDRIFLIEGCKHCYCFSCMKQHVEVKLLYGLVPKCPHEGCDSELQIDSCRKFLSPKLIDIMIQRLKEASIPVTEKVYCPYPKCSALMSKQEVVDYSKPTVFSNFTFGRCKCEKCGGLFCLSCKVPWHDNMSCKEYRRKNPPPLAEDAKLKNLAARNLWRQCVKCNHMIELAAGCFHMTCRCGYEFCYTCGAEWKEKKQTCTCLLWEENNILDYDSEEEYLSDVDNFYGSDSDDYL